MLSDTRMSICLVLLTVASAVAAPPKVEEIPSPDFSVLDAGAEKLAKMNASAREEWSKRDAAVQGCYVPNSQNNDSKNLVALRIESGILPRNREIIGCYNGKCLTGNIYYVDEDSYFWYYKMSSGPNYKIAIYKTDLGGSYGYYVSIADQHNTFLFYNWTFRCN